MAGTGEIRYLTIRPSHQNVTVDATLVSGHHKPLYVFIPQAGYYPPNALTFGDFGARTGAVVILEQTLQLLGELSNRVATYGTTEDAQRVRFDGALFDRICAFVVKITNDSDETVGRLLCVYWAKMSLEVEDADLEDRAEGPKKKAEIAKRERHRDLNKYLKSLMAPKQKVDDNGRPVEAKGTPQFWYHHMTYNTYVNHFAAKLTSFEPVKNLGLEHKDQPVNIHNLLGIDSACREMHAAGASAMFYDRATYANNNLSVPSANVWKVQPTELHWTSLSQACFPDIPRPTVDRTSAEFKFHADRFYGQLRDSKQWMRAEEGADEERKAQVAAHNDHLQEELTAEAERHATFVMEQCLSSVGHELSSHDTYRAATVAFMADALAKAGANPEARAKAILRVQRQQLQKFPVFLRRSQVLSDSYVAMRDWLQEYLDTHGGTFWRDIKRPAHFSNLTEFGAFVAMLPLEQEAIFENYNVHRHAITVHLASLHVYFTHAPLHVWVFLTGDPKAGKSFTGRQALCYIPGTVRESQGETEKAKMESGNGGARRYGFQISLEEELQPSMLGLDGLHGKNLDKARKSNAMSDGASRVRHGATSHTVTWTRLVPNPSTGRYEAEHIKYTLHQTIIGAINLPAHLFPENMKSRAMLLEYVSKMRASGETLTHRILFPKPDKYNMLKDKAVKEKMRLSQGLLAMACMMMDDAIIQPPKFTAAKGFIDEVASLATQRGITGVSDVRHLQRITALMEVICVIFAQWRFYTDPKSPANGVPHSWHHILQQEKNFSVSIEQAVFVLTLCEEQFENPLASAVLKAIKDSHFARGIRVDAACDHSEIHLADPSDQKRADSSTGFWCAKLYNSISDKMEFRPPREAGINYLEELSTTQVTSAGGKRIDALRIQADGRCQIANVLLHGIQQDRFLRCVQEVLCRKHYPAQRYVLGRLDPDAPFIWQTFSNDPKDQDATEKADFEKLTKIAEVRRQRDLEGMSPNHPAYNSGVLVKHYASHEKVIWDVLLRHHGNEAAIEESFRNSLINNPLDPLKPVELINRDREDIGALQDWNSRGVTKDIWRDLLSDNKAVLKLPTQCRKDYQQEILTLAMAQCKDWKKEQSKYQYPTCFASRNHQEFLQGAVQDAIKNPDAFLTSAQYDQLAELMGVREPVEGKPPPDPQEPAPAAAAEPPKEHKRSSLGPLGQQRSPSRKRPREEQPEAQTPFDVFREGMALPSAAKKPRPSPEKKMKKSPGILDLFNEEGEADAVQMPENKDPEAQAIVDSPPAAAEPAMDSSPDEKKKKKKKKKATGYHSDDYEDLEEEYQRRAAELGYGNNEIGVEITGETEDDQPPEVHSDEGYEMLASSSSIEAEEREADRKLRAEAKQANKDARESERQMREEARERRENGEDSE